MNLDNMRDLIEKLNYYTKLYDEGQPAISDEEWDNMYFKLQEMEKETGIILATSTLKQGGQHVISRHCHGSGRPCGRISFSRRRSHRLE